MLCECGCGQRTNLSPYTDPTRGYIKGKPRRFVAHHYRPPAEDLAQRFWSKVQKSDDCWLWTGAKCGHGSYGLLHMAGTRKMKPASHVSWFLAYGSWPKDGQFACHHCDNPECVRPDHLFLGNARDNAQDSIRKGRFRHQTFPRGVRNGRAKMTPATAREARNKFTAGETITVIARHFSVARSTVRDIVRGHRWQESAEAVV